VVFLVPIIELSRFKTLSVDSSSEHPPNLIIEDLESNNKFSVEGGVLEAQFSVDDSYLLFISEGNPLEEALFIYFLDSNLNIRDVIELSANYTAGVLRNRRIIDNSSIRFSFFGEEEWVLKVLENPKLLLFGPKYPIKRKLSVFKRAWLVLEKARNN